MTMWRPLPKTDRKSSLRPTHKIVANRIGKTTGHRTIIGATTNNHGDPALTTIRGQATTPTETKQLAFSARNWATGRRIAERGSTQINPVWTQAVKLSGLKLTLLTMGHQSRLSRTRIFNSELDGTPTSSSCRHSSNHYEFVCCFNCNV
jgi:hypothetical protein